MLNLFCQHRCKVIINSKKVHNIHSIAESVNKFIIISYIDYIKNFTVDDALQQFLIVQFIYFFNYHINRSL